MHKKQLEIMEEEIRMIFAVIATIFVFTQVPTQSDLDVYKSAYKNSLKEQWNLTAAMWELIEQMDEEDYDHYGKIASDNFPDDYKTQYEKYLYMSDQFEYVYPWTDEIGFDFEIMKKAESVPVKTDQKPR